jgi:P27 family predicted phage terminase small subunit
VSKPGPTGKPFELRALEGGGAGGRSHRPLDVTGLFRPEVGMPPLPKDLSTAARKVWKRLGPELLRYNLLSIVFSDAFEDLCETIADVKTLRRALRARQALMRDQGKDEAEAWQANTPNGMPVQHPLALNLRNARADMQKLLDKFGLSPAEQASVTTAVRAQLQLFESATPAGSKPDPDAPPPSAQQLPSAFSDF